MRMRLQQQPPTVAVGGWSGVGDGECESWP
jgi:hypothetical protein